MSFSSDIWDFWLIFTAPAGTRMTTIPPRLFDLSDVLKSLIRALVSCFRGIEPRNIGFCYVLMGFPRPTICIQYHSMWFTRFWPWKRRFEPSNMVIPEVMVGYRDYHESQSLSDYLGDFAAVSWHCSLGKMDQFTSFSGDCISTFRENLTKSRAILPFLGCTSRGQSRPPDTRLGMAASQMWRLKGFRKWQTPAGMPPVSFTRHVSDFDRLEMNWKMSQGTLTPEQCSRQMLGICTAFYSYGHGMPWLVVINAYKWDYAFYKCGFLSTYNWFI